MACVLDHVRILLDSGLLRGADLPRHAVVLAHQSCVPALLGVAADLWGAQHVCEICGSCLRQVQRVHPPVSHYCVDYHH